MIHTFSLYFDVERITIQHTLTPGDLGCVLAGAKLDGGFGLFEREGQTYYETIAEIVRQVEERCPELRIKKIEATPVAVRAWQSGRGYAGKNSSGRTGRSDSAVDLDRAWTAHHGPITCVSGWLARC